jgi:hypothetical protein
MANKSDGLLRDLVNVLDSIERCKSCQHLLNEEAADECHHGSLERALGRARTHLASGVLRELAPVDSSTLDEAGPSKPAPPGSIPGEGATHP